MRFTALVFLLSHCKFLIQNLGFLELKFETNFLIESMDLRTKIIEVFAVLILIAESACAFQSSTQIEFAHRPVQSDASFDSIRP